MKVGRHSWVSFEKQKAEKKHNPTAVLSSDALDDHSVSSIISAGAVVLSSILTHNYSMWLSANSRCVLSTDHERG